MNKNLFQQPTPELASRRFAALGRLLFLSLAIFPALGRAEWQQHEIQQLNGQAARFQLPAQFQIVTERWNRVVAVPYIVNMPEKDRLLMLVGCDYPHRAFVLTSDPVAIARTADEKPWIHLGSTTASSRDWQAHSTCGDGLRAIRDQFAGQHPLQYR